MPPVVPIPPGLLEELDKNLDVNNEFVEVISPDEQEQVGQLQIEFGEQIRENENEDGTEKMRPVGHWSEVYPGMFAYMKYLGFWHAVLVTEVFADRKVLKGVHFAWPGLLKRRVIQEDEFEVNLGNNDLWEVRIPVTKRVSSDVAIERARQKIGEKGFNMFTRRSSHVVKECVMKT